MAKIFGILTAVVLVAAAFFAFKNKEAYEIKIADTEEVNRKLESNTKRLNVALEGVKEVEEKVAANEAETIKSNGEIETATSKIAELKLQVETKGATVKTNTEELAKVRDQTAKIGSLRELAADLRSARTEREEVIAKIALADTELANFNTQIEQAQQQADTVRKRLELFNSGQSLPSLNTRIQSIYPSWGFVTLAAGNSGGVVTNSVLNVIRGDETIARLLVTAVERGTSSASIIPDSLAQDVTLMVGDRVVAASKPGAILSN